MEAVNKSLMTAPMEIVSVNLAMKVLNKVVSLIENPKR